MNRKGIFDDMRNRSAFRDFIIILIVASLVFVVEIFTDATDRIFNLAHEHKGWHLEEIIGVLVFLAFAFGIFSVRRVRELREDIAQRKKSAAIQNRLAATVESSNDAIISKTLDGIITSWNAGAERIFGYSAAEIVGQNIGLLFPPDRLDEELQFIEKIKRGEHITNYVTERIAKNGSRIPVSLTVSPLKDFDGNIVGASKIIHDITARKQAQESLQKSEERFKLISRATNDTLWDWNLLTNELWWNENFYKMFGYREEEVEPTIESWTSRLHPEDAERIGHEVHELIESGGQTWTGEYRFQRGDGSYSVVIDRAYLVHDEQGNPVRMVGSLMDITERKQIEEKLKSREAQLAESQQIAHLGSWEWDIRENKVQWSDEEYRIFGLQPQEFGATYEAYLERVHPDDREMVTGIIEKALQEKEYPSFEHRVVRPDGTLRIISADGKVVLDEDGNPIKMVGITLDITEQKQFEAELEQARDAALESARLKSEFLANMSHEIRTPMNGVIGMTGLLLDTDLNDEQRDYAETIRQSSDSLLTVINDILDFSKIEAGKLHFETLDFDLRNVVEGAVDLFAERAHVKELELISNIDANVPTPLRGDPGRLRQVLVNLLGNALKFTERGEVVLCIGLEKETDTGAVLNFRIRDTGIGISADAQKRLFQAFVQADGSTTRKYGGTGLGLAISKQLVEAMGGEISVKSEEGKGSTFKFTAHFKKQPAGAIAAQPEKAQLENVRVLIVDDNATNRKVLLRQTASWGMNATAVESAARALKVLREATSEGQPFDLALLDLHMPETDGFDLARAIKADSAIAGVRLVLMPSYGLRGDAQLARILGIAAYLMKPVRQSQLFDCLATVMAERLQTDELPDAPGNLVTRHTLEEARLLSRRRILVVEDNPVNQKVATRQLEKLGQFSDVAANGREAIEALERTQYDIVLMDCQMPEMDGYEATAEIRRREGSTKHTVIIAMTANAMEGEREKCLAAGMDDYISKPIKPEKLREALERWSESPASANDTNDAHTQENADAVDLSVLASLGELAQEEDSNFVAELKEIYLRNTAEKLSVLRQALATEDSATLLKELHSLKGSSANLGANPMAALCESFEQLPAEARQTERTTILQRMENELERIRQKLGDI